MNELKHTPGPWIVRQSELHGERYGGLWVEAIDLGDDRGERLLPITGSGGAKSYTTRLVDIQIHDDNDANAHLIAAAPDLLEALKKVMSWIKNWDVPFLEDERWPETKYKVDAALSKAGGEGR